HDYNVWTESQQLFFPGAKQSDYGCIIYGLKNHLKTDCFTLRLQPGDQCHRKSKASAIKSLNAKANTWATIPPHRAKAPVK
ncbi:MAG: hypothetical protein K0B11_22685, partial [Mariniphaga sp.]|nr:hypothetical protein [Mariniphaga sp.]